MYVMSRQWGTASVCGMQTKPRGNYRCWIEMVFHFFSSCFFSSRK